MNPLFNIISSELVRQGIDLTPLGFCERAWDKETIKIVLQELNDKKIGVLGGDVYKILGNTIQVTFDSWYINNDGLPDFYQKSIKKALEYIQKYEERNDGSFVYSITI